ncbi:MAG: thiolase family protein [Fervidicoccaceae archaeon]
MVSYVSGIGFTKVGRHYELSLADLAREAAVRALEQAGVDGVDALVVSNLFADALQGESMLGPLVLEELGFAGAQVLSVGGGEASGLLAVHVARSLVESKMARDVLVVGVEKLSDASSAAHASLLERLVSADYEGIYGVNLAALYALAAAEYMRRFSVSEELLALWPVLMHEHSLNAQHGQLRFKLTVERVLGSEPLSPPLRQFHAHQLGDGAAALLISSESSRAPKEARLAELLYTASAGGPLEYSLRKDPVWFETVAVLTRAMLSAENLEPRKIDLVEVTDSYSIGGPLCVEAMGLSERGRTLRDVAEGRFGFGDRPTLNVAGGVKARGHPYGATGVYQVAEIVSAMHGIYGVKQLSGTEFGVAVAIGGYAAVAAGALLRRT